MFRLITVLLLVLLLAACNLPMLTSTPTLDTADLPTGVEITTPASGGGDCAWVWNSEPLPELSIQLQSAMEQAGLGDAAGRAIAFGEDCISADTGEVSYFAVKQTDFRFSLPVKDLTDLDAMGELVEGVLSVIDKFPPDDTPGPTGSTRSVSRGSEADRRRQLTRGVHRAARSTRGDSGSV